MSGPSDQEIWDWIVAYHDALKARGTGQYTLLELQVLTRLGQLSGLLSPDQARPVPCEDELLARLVRCFTVGSGCPELSTRHSNYFSALTGPGLAIEIKNYHHGTYYQLFVREIGRFMQTLSLGGVGWLVAANVIDAICRKHLPEKLPEIARKCVVAAFEGSQRAKAEKLLPTLLGKCVSAVMEVASDPEDPYLLELERFLDSHLWDTNAPEQAFVPTFGL